MTAPWPGPSSLVGDWAAARSHPHTYPGDCPPGSFVVVDEAVHPLTMADPGDLSSLLVHRDDRTEPLDGVLEQRSLPPLAERVPVVAYGGNRNPGTIALKCQHYHYASPGKGNLFIALRGTLRGVDVVAGGLSDQGYLYGDLYLGDEVADTQVTVWLLLLDPDGLRMMHDSEGLQLGGYACARLEDVTVDGFDRTVGALAYAGEMPVFRSPAEQTPLAFESVAATGRRLPGYQPVAMLDHALDVLGLTDRARQLCGLSGPVDDLGGEVMKFLNGQFWYRRNTGERRTASCEELELAIWEALLGSACPTSTAEALRARGAVLDHEQAYAPPEALTVGGWWGD